MGLYDVRCQSSDDGLNWTRVRSSLRNRLPGGDRLYFFIGRCRVANGRR